MAEYVINGRLFSFVWSVGYCLALFKGNVRDGVPDRERHEAEARLDHLGVSDVFKDFLQHALMVDPVQRWTASQLQEHPFIKQSAGREKELVKRLVPRYTDT